VLQSLITDGSSCLLLWLLLLSLQVKLTLYAATNAASRIVGLQWYNGSQGYTEPGAPTLAICYDNGRCQIMRDENDDNPILIDTMINANRMEWNTNGSVLAIAGTKINVMPNGEQKEAQMVQFYTPFGKHLRTLKVMGSGISSLSWEGGSLRLALAVDSFIYFANIRPDYKW
jgi:WD repeat-containing protein 35